MIRITIGEFAQRCRIPVSTLRYYHELGIFEPVEVDPDTGYRYYTHDQLAIAVRIADYRAAGLSPNQIQELLSGVQHGAALARVRAELVADLELRQQRLDRFDRLVAAGPVGPVLGPVKRAEASFAWSASQSVTVSTDNLVRSVRRGFVDLRRESGAKGALAATFPLDLAHDFVKVDLHIESSEPSSTHPPATPVLKVIHVGPHRTLWTAYDALIDQVRSHDKVAGHVTERYLPPQSSQPQTEVLLHLNESEPTK